jgi:hypothetical protein
MLFLRAWQADSGRNMRIYYELANFLLSAWRLGRPGTRLPTSHGILDRALEEVAAQLPPRFKGKLTFVETPIGRLCRELPEILRAAQESYLTSEPNPTYRTAEVKLSAAAAFDLLDRLDIDIEAAKNFGEELSKSIDRQVKAVATAVPAA